MSRLIFALTSLFALAAQAQPIATVVDYPGTAPWAAACGAPNAAPGGASQIGACNPAVSNCLLRMTLPAGPGQEFVHARCNDGSPGVFYVRPGSGDNVNKWVIHTQGGGACRDHGSCLERWCGQQGNLPYTANKMSSDWDGDGLIDLPLYGQTGGMAIDHPANDYADWTHVWMYYCSSDSWMGRASNVSYLDPLGATDFTIDQRGHTILYAARRMLRKNSADPAWTTDDGTVVPDLDDATDVVFTGTSAGAKGAVQNADWFLGPLSAPNKSLILDGNLDMTDDVLLSHDIWIDEDGDGVGDDSYYSWRITNSLDSWNSGWNQAVNAFIDESCRAVYEPLGRLDRCSYFGTLFILHTSDPFIETNTFIRMDLEDGVVSKLWKGTSPTGLQLQFGQFGGPTTVDDFGILLRESLEQIYDEVDNEVSAVYATRCQQHVGLESTAVFGQQSTSDSSYSLAAGWSAVGASATLHDAIGMWIAAPLAGLRMLDTGDMGDPTLPNDPITDPIVKFSNGPSCPY